LASEEGVQQGDLLAPLLFSLALSSVLDLPRCDFVSGYLDDASLGGSVVDLAGEVVLFQRQAAKLGLELNIDKCEIIGLQDMSRSDWSNFGLQFHEPSEADALLLGSPFYNVGIDKTVSKHANALEMICARLQLLTSNEAFYFLKSSLAMPKWLYLLRTSLYFFLNI